MTHSGFVNETQDAAVSRSRCHSLLSEGATGRLDRRVKKWVCVRTKHRLLLVDVWSREVRSE